MKFEARQAIDVKQALRGRQPTRSTFALLLKKKKKKIEQEVQRGRAIHSAGAPDPPAKKKKKIPCVFNPVFFFVALISSTEEGDSDSADS